MRPSASASAAGANQSRSQARSASIQSYQSADRNGAPAASSSTAAPVPSAGRSASVAALSSVAPAARHRPAKNGSAPTMRSAIGRASTSAPWPNSHTELTGSRPRASRARLTGWSYHVICTSFWNLRQARSCSP